MAKIPYIKPVLSVAEQITLLKERGITFSDEESSAQFLTYHNYYYVSGYIYYFEKKSDVRTHCLKTQIDFSDVISIIRYDQQLRELFFGAVQTIEFALRSSIARNLADMKTTFCLEDCSIFKSAYLHNILMDNIQKALHDRKKEPFLTHYSSVYEEEIPPVWITIELLTFGAVSRLYANLKTPYQKQIADELQTDHIVLVSWLKAVTELRNTCAHHSRLWNKVFVNAPKIRKADKGFPLNENGNYRIGAFIPMAMHLLNVIGERSDWEELLLGWIEQNRIICLSDMGLERVWK